jgi:predicted secreted protein
MTRSMLRTSAAVCVLLFVLIAAQAQGEEKEKKLNRMALSTRILCQVHSLRNSCRSTFRGFCMSL